MANYVVWLDHNTAKIFELRPEGPVEREMKRGSSHALHKQPYPPKGGTTHKDEELFFQEVASNLLNAHELLLVGPGLAKTQFKHHLDKHHNSTLSKKIVGTETVDHPTDNQLIALGKRFFKNHLKFE